MHYLTSLWINLHKRGIQAMLLAGCLLGFGLGQTFGASYRSFADHANRAATGRDGAAAVTNQAGGGLGNTVAGQQAARATPTPAPHVMTQTLPNKGHQANTNGDGGKKVDGKGKGNGGKKPPKAKGHRTGNDGGPHGKQGKDGGHKGQDNGGGHGQSNNQGGSVTIILP